jgi:serine phosphatase RsbU (regulator of sigma subunit)
MAKLIILQGPSAGRQFPLTGNEAVIGRQPDSTIYLDSLSVSRQHARILRQGDAFLVEDAGSSNGTFLNGERIRGTVPLRERDSLQIGPYLLGLRTDAPFRPPDSPNPHISAEISVLSSSMQLFGQNPAHKLQVVLDIAQHLSRTLDVDQLLRKLLDHLFRLFPQADRGMALLCEQGRPVVRAQRGIEEQGEFPYSRSIVQRALDQGVGILSEDLGTDQRIAKTETLLSLKLNSLLCVPLICQERRLGVIQLDCSQRARSFRSEDLELLTAVAMQVAVVLDNVALHAERLREERFHQELAMAREIQQGFLPTDFAPLGKDVGFELFARIHPAREVSGDLYDFFPVGDGKLAFFLGDVSGKGMPAALFMIAVRTLCRHLAAEGKRPAETLAWLNEALAVDNPSAMFVTLIHGIYDPKAGDLVLCSGGHPPPLLRRPDGKVDVLPVTAGRLLGYPGGNLGLTDTAARLDPGETLIFYTDGFTEAFSPDRTMFEVERLAEAVGGPRSRLSLEECLEEARAAIERFTGSAEQQDDLTMLLLRRKG